MTPKSGSRHSISGTGQWEALLEPGEALLWQGRPAGGVRLEKSAALPILVGGLFLAFLPFVYITYLTPDSGGPINPVYYAIAAALALFGLWQVAGRWIFDAYQRKNTRYGLTSKRAIIAISGFGGRVKSYPINRKNNLSLEEGTLDRVNFAQRIQKSKDGDRIINIGFRYIEDGQEVFRLLQKVRKENLDNISPDGKPGWQ